MTSPQPAFTEFVGDATGGLVIRVSHLLEPVVSQRLRITHAAQAFGPAGPARQIGRLITADFPETMASLVALGAGPA